MKCICQEITELEGNQADEQVRNTKHFKQELAFEGVHDTLQDRGLIIIPFNHISDKIKKTFTIIMIVSLFTE